MILTLLLWAVVVALFGFLCFAAYVQRERLPGSKAGRRLTVAFFHPYCCSGGGGERVLWCAVQAMQQKYDNVVKCYVYTGDLDRTPADIEATVKQRFGIKLRPSSVQFVHLRYRHLLDAANYPRLTLLCQSIAGLLVAAEALLRFRPDVFIETTGFATALGLFRLVGRCRTATYVHYPTISTDMLQMVAQRRPAYNNDQLVTKGRWLTAIKLLYYYLFAKAYGMIGYFGAQVVMVNSTWTKNHIVQLWRCAERVHLVFPPCDVSQLTAIPLDDRFATDPLTLTVVALGQFRPEKDYPLTIRSFSRLLDLLSGEPELRQRLRLVLIGGVRDHRDHLLVDQLQDTARRLHIADKIQWKVNSSYEDLLTTLSKGAIGIHTMWNEHFGIGIVEMMAAGLLTVAHNSGGPKMDIVQPEGQVGFLASTEHEYAQQMAAILHMPSDQRLCIQRAARNSTAKFDVDHFQRSFLHAIGPIVLAEQ